MSYKAVWYQKERVAEIAKNFGLQTEDLLDRGSKGEPFDGAYGANIAEKLHKHPLTVTSIVDDYMAKSYQRIRIARTPPTFQGHRVWECGCGWSGPGTGHKGSLVEGDRCPECGVYL